MMSETTEKEMIKKHNTPGPIKIKPMFANVPAKGKPGTIGKPTSGVTRDKESKTLKQAVMGRSKFHAKVGTQSSAIKD